MLRIGSERNTSFLVRLGLDLIRISANGDARPTEKHQYINRRPEATYPSTYTVRNSQLAAISKTAMHIADQ